MFLIELESKNCLSSLSAVKLSPMIPPAMGMGGGQGFDGMGPEAEQYSQLIGKSLIPRAPILVNDKKEEQKRKRAKRANEIFRIVSKSAGLGFFFFDKFLVWSDYVEAKLNEEEFTEKVREEVNLKASSLKN